ncbi:ABC transporter permease [Brevibacillus sp. HB1.2]|uniref:ABC transporter permease n=1 Tax=Brevibacillus porteri TaxID=2126350 RepID=A0ABX5FPN6_9BACL|nr:MULTISPECIES: ABC transporter permease [Brevibacillus]ATF16121.1 ABC transporter permease [Brevibacillus brevis X23]MDC0761480.1 ABC transporter permease [Brevibacillus sp. AG]MED1800384.1 ABC transporter permease [Brevibacillus porteri]MED2134035.1 ABC transporter permease [Brevibacillus porteri]MED2743087.1 ABC transporter permease [Brevibacillus porteri]
MELFDWSLLSSTIRMVTPILLAALGGALCARVGIFNVGLEGLVLVGAFSAIVGNHFTGNLFLAVLIAALVSIVFSLLFAYMTIKLRANEIVVGVAINFLALGLTTFALRAIFGVKGAFYDKDMVGLPTVEIPFIHDIPVIGGIVSGHSPLVYFAFLAAILLYVFFYRTVTGFRVLAVGLNPVAARSLGLKVTGLQMLAIVMSGALCGIAGAQLSLGQVTMFTEGMTAGRGFIALVAMMMGQSHPLGILASSFLFGLMDALSIRLQGFSLPTQFTAMLPYVLTIVAMFFLKNKSQIGSDNQQSTR